MKEKTKDMHYHYLYVTLYNTVKSPCYCNMTRKRKCIMFVRNTISYSHIMSLGIYKTLNKLWKIELKREFIHRLKSQYINKCFYATRYNYILIF